MVVEKKVLEMLPGSASKVLEAILPLVQVEARTQHRWATGCNKLCKHLTRVVIWKLLIPPSLWNFLYQTSCWLYVDFYSENLIAGCCPLHVPFPAIRRSNSQWTACSFIPVILASWRNPKCSWNACIACWNWHHVVSFSLSGSWRFQCAVRGFTPHLKPLCTRCLKPPISFMFYSLLIWHIIWSVTNVFYRSRVKQSPVCFTSPLGKWPPSVEETSARSVFGLSRRVRTLFGFEPFLICQYSGRYGGQRGENLYLTALCFQAVDGLLL